MTFRLKVIFKQFFFTYFAQVIILIATLIIYRMIAHNFGPEGMGKYSLIKKVAVFLESALLLGLAVGLPRYIAISQKKIQRAAYLKIAWLIACVNLSIFLIFVNLFKEGFAKIFFGQSNYTNLILPFSSLLVGLMFCSLVYSYFRGRLFVKTFNFFQLIYLILIPLISFLLLKNSSIEKVITVIGIDLLLISCVFLLPLTRELFLSIPKKQLKESLKKLMRYSIPRLPADFALNGLFALGPIIAAHFITIQEVGYLSISQNLIHITGMAIAPLGIILLPQVSALIIGGGKEKVIKAKINLFIPALIQCSIFLCFQLVLFTKVIVKFWLGSEFFPAVPLMRLMSISVIFYIFYVGMRSILDAVKIKPLNTINLFISLGVFLGTGGILLFLIRSFSVLLSLGLAFTLAMVCLGVLTYIVVKKIYHTSIKRDLYCLWIAIFINFLLGGIAIIMKAFVSSNLYYFLVFEIFLSIIYLLILWLLKMEWIRQIPSSIFKNYA